jgi:hypothetical protein
MAKLTIEFEIGTMLPSRIHNAFATAYGWQATVPNPLYGEPVAEGQPAHPATIANPQTKPQHTKARIRQYIKDIIEGEERRAAAAAAQAAVAVVDIQD